MTYKRVQAIRAIGLFTLVLASLGVSSCKRGAVSEGSVRFAQLQNVHGSLTYLADQQGFIRQQGLQYQPIILAAGPDIVTALRVPGSNGVDAGGLAATPIVTMIGAGEKPVILASMLYSTKSIKLVATRSSGITMDPSTLRGKKIGVVRNTVGDIYLSKLLQRGGLSESAVTVVDGRPSDLATLLASGHLDAAVLWDPYAVQAVREITQRIPGASAVSLVDPSIHPFTMFVVTMQPKLAVKRAEFQKLLRALISAQEFTDKDPAKAEQILEGWMHLAPGDLHDFFSTSKFEVTVNRAQTVQVLTEELQWLKERRPSTNVPDDLSPYLDSSLLEEIDPSRIVK